MNNVEKIKQDEPVSIDFEQELYKAFGQVKDFSLGMRIAKWFFDMGTQRQKEQMMKDAIEGTICISAPEPLVVRAEVKEEDGFKFADRVKIIVIKED